MKMKALNSKIFIAVFVCWFCLLGVPPALSDDPDRGNLAMIVEKPSKAKIIADLSVLYDQDISNSEKEMVYMGGVFEVKFREFEVLFGKLESKKLNLKLTALHLEYFTKGGEIFVLIDVSDQENPKGLWWDFVYDVACFDPSVIEKLNDRYDDLNIKKNLKDFVLFNNQKCKVISESYN